MTISQIIVDAIVYYGENKYDKDYGMYMHKLAYDLEAKVCERIIKGLKEEEYVDKGYTEKTE